MGFGEACEIRVGDLIRTGGRDQVVMAVRHYGRDWPYFQVPSATPTTFEVGGPDWVSWQCCGPVPVPAGWDHV